MEKFENKTNDYILEVIENDGVYWFPVDDILMSLNPNILFDEEMKQSYYKVLKGLKIKVEDIINNDSGEVFACIRQEEVFKFLKKVDTTCANFYATWIIKKVIPALYGVEEEEEPKNLDEKIKIAEFKINAAEAIFKVLDTPKNERALGINNIVKEALDGDGVLSNVGIQLEAPAQRPVFNPTEIGELFGISAQAVNKIFKELGLQIKVKDSWYLTEEGCKFGVMLNTHKTRSYHGKSTCQIKWYAEGMELIEEYLKDQSK